MAIASLVGTVVAHRLALLLFVRAGGSPLLNPVLVAAAAVLLALAAADVPTSVYATGTRPLRLLLGPATVALAVPLARLALAGGRRVRVAALAAVAGGVVATASAVLVAAALRAAPPVVLALSTKSVTTAIAVGIADAAGAPLGLAVALVIVTGISGAVLGDWWLDRLRVRHPADRAIAVGVVAHAIGTEHVLRQSHDLGALAAVAMTVNGVATALWLPAMLALLD